MQKEIDVNAADFGLQVRKALLELNVPQKEVAKRADIANAYLSDILNNNRYAPDTRRRIVAALIDLERESGCKPVEK